jgi:hypothetical protein
MKLLYLCVFLLVCSFSCKKQSDNGYMNATLNGGSWAADEYLGTRTAEGLTIQGCQHYSSGDYSNIGITLPLNYAVGTYNIESGGPAHASYTPHTYSNTIQLASYGTVTLTSVAPYVIGTFSFTCSDSTKVENGRFSVVRP